jgi:uncharacterized protein with ParB-like and HNH nuclease domain
LDGIGHILNDKVLVVPQYQRAYSWQKDQVELFWNDLRTAVDASEPEYFLGTVVVTAEQSNRRLNIIDGQQRLATVTMLLAAIRNALLAGGEANRAETLEREYLASRDLRSNEISPHLFLGNEDDNYFRSIVIHRQGFAPIPVTTYRSNRRINEAFSCLSSHVDALVANAHHNWQEVLFDWVDFIYGKLKVILVQVPNESNAFLIFETLNDRGFALTTADLLKNWLFSLSGNRIGVVQNAWIAAVSGLEMTTEEELFLDFLRHYWGSLHGTTTQRMLR